MSMLYQHTWRSSRIDVVRLDDGIRIGLTAWNDWRQEHVLSDAEAAELLSAIAAGLPAPVEEGPA